MGSQFQLHVLVLLLSVFVVLGQQIVKILKSVVICQKGLVHSSQRVCVLLGRVSALFRKIQLIPELYVVLFEKFFL